MAENNNTVKYRVGQLEDSVESLNEKVDKIRTNELPHIKEEILESKAEITKEISDLKMVVKENTVKVAVIVSVLTAIFSLIVNYLI